MPRIQIGVSLEAPAQTRLLRELSGIVARHGIEIRKDWNLSNPIFAVNLLDGDDFRHGVNTFNKLVNWAKQKEVTTHFHWIDPEMEFFEKISAEQAHNLIEGALERMDRDDYYEIH